MVRLEIPAFLRVFSCMICFCAEGNDVVEVKGWRNGLLFLISEDGDWSELMRQVADRLDEGRGRAFWKGAQATIDFGGRPVGDSEMATFVDHLKDEYGIIPLAVVGSDPSTRNAAEKLVLTTYETLPTVQKPTREPEPAAPTLPAGAVSALYLPSTVRSGQRIVHDGAVIVAGDVNAGAEVFAGSDIIVLGTLRGLAHAGCHGNESSRIFALNLRPPQLRIAGRIARAPEEPAKASQSRGPELARIEDGEIGVEPWRVL